MPALEERTQPVLDGRLFGAEDERTLDDLVVGVLYDASRGDPVACPVCGIPSFGIEDDDLLACGSCGTRLEADAP
jgi:ribosomal protein S27AE